MRESLSDFNEFRSEMNEEIHASDHLGMKRFFALDHQAYQDGALEGRPRSYWDLWHRQCCDATIASPITWCSAARRAGSGKK